MKTIGFYHPHGRSAVVISSKLLRAWVMMGAGYRHIKWPRQGPLQRLSGLSIIGCGLSHYWPHRCLLIDKTMGPMVAGSNVAAGALLSAHDSSGREDEPV